MSDAHRDFAEAAHPHSWFLVADNLHEQAVRLRSSHGEGMMTRIDATGRAVSWDATNRTVFLIAGFALENAIKGFLVYENPSWVSNGRLSKKLRSHALVSLSDMSSHIPYKVQGRGPLGEFESGLESWARYPCGLSADAMSDPPILDDRLWSWYLRLTGAYGRRLRKLLSKGWKGPHGLDGRLTIRGEFLGSS